MPVRVKGQRKDMCLPMIEPMASDIGGLESVFAYSPFPRMLQLPYTNDSCEDIYLKRGKKVADVHDTVGEELLYVPIFQFRMPL